MRTLLLTNRPDESYQSTSYCQKEEEIQTLELLGASLAVSTQEPRLDLAFTYLERAMQLRYSDPVVLKVSLQKKTRFCLIRGPKKLRVTI